MKKKSIQIVVVFTILLAFCFTTGAAGDGIQPNTLIAFSSINRAGSGSTDADIWTIDPNDPTQLTQLTNQGEHTRSPRWSPDGARIAFTQGRRGDERLFVINADGSGVRQVSQSHLRITAQFWSLDGERIYINTDEGGGPCGFAWIEADGSPGQPEHPIIGAEQKCHTDVSPDRSKVVFLDYGSGNDLEIGDLSTDGNVVSNIEVLFALPADQIEMSEPDWSPDGSRIAFGMDPGWNSNIYTINANGTDFVPITSFSDRFHATSSTWSPDGSMLAFAVYNFDTGKSDIYITSSDGSFDPVINLTPDDLHDGHPDWSLLL